MIQSSMCGLAWLLAFSVQASAEPAASPAAAPPPPAAPVQKVLGEVTSVDVAAGRISVKPDAGQAAAVTITAATACLKTQPGAKDLAAATPIACAEIAVADRVFARGSPADGGSTLSARQIVVMTRDDLSRKHETEAADWRRRGTAGVVKSVDPSKGEITMEVRSLGETREVLISTAERSASLRHYAPGSARFSDSRPCSFDEIGVGDQVRVLGDRSPDGARVAAEQVVAGAFRTVVGTVDDVRVEGREIALTSLSRRPGGKDALKEKLVVVLGADAPLKRLPEEMATRLAARRAGGGGLAMGGRFGRRGGTPSGRASSEGSSEERAGAGGRGASLGEMLDRLPSITLADLAPGAVVAVAVAGQGDAARTPATALLAGVEPLVTEAAVQAINGGTGGGAAGLEDLDLGMGFSQ